MSMEPAISLEEAQQIVDTKTAPRVTEEQIKERIAKVHYITFTEDDNATPVGTLCLMRMQNGFTVTGFSAAASAENFDPEVGQRYAYENAFKQLWPLEGYLLREKLHILSADD